MRSLLPIVIRRSAQFFALVTVTLTALLSTPRVAFAQSAAGRVVVRVTADSLPIVGATVASGTANGATDRSGFATFNLPAGRRTFRVSSFGYLPESLAVNVSSGMTNVSVALRHETVVTNDVVAAERDLRRMPNEATTVDVTSRAELDEQIELAPGSVADLVSHLDGVRTQPLSAGSAGLSIRIRGMPGQYTKILMDGLPLFGSTPEGLELLQTSALGVQRVEVLKGVSSALYGPTALGGVVNIVSASPTAPSEAIVNGSSRFGSDVGVWQTHTFTPRWSASLLAGRHYQSNGDPDGDGWAEVNGYRRIVVRPRVNWARSNTSNWFMTGGWTSENRRSGTFENARLPDFHKYSDDADTRRADAGTVGRIDLDTNVFITVRASMTREWRTRWYGENREQDRRSTIFGDVAITKLLGEHALVGGVALERDQYAALDDREFSYRYTTPAVYGEHTWTPRSWFGVTSGARLDLHSEFGDFVSPRVSVVLGPSNGWTARISAASGVNAPTPLTEETEALGFSHVRRSNREAEHATGWTLDVGHVAGPFELRGSAHRTVINHPLVLRTLGEELQLANADEASHTQGIDLSARYRMQRLRYTATYSFIDASRPEIGRIFGEDFEFDTTMTRSIPLNPQHSLAFDAAYEHENDRLVGVEVHVVGPQPLSDTLYATSRLYVTLDARFEKHIGPVILFARGQNLTNVRQSQFFPLLLTASGPAGQWTREAWAPLGGIAVNAGLRLKY